MKHLIAAAVLMSLFAAAAAVADSPSRGNDGYRDELRDGRQDRDQNSGRDRQYRDRDYSGHNDRDYRDRDGRKDNRWDRRNHRWNGDRDWRRPRYDGDRKHSRKHYRHRHHRHDRDQRRRWW